MTTSAISESTTALDAKHILPDWQNAAWAIFAARRLGGKMPHALMLTASPGLGLHQFAEQVRASLLCMTPLTDAHACESCRSCVARHAGSHPDDCAIHPEEGKVSIGIDLIRWAAERLSKTPQAGGFQVALIEPAHAMTVAAANALLKTLEEPARDTVLILVSEQPGKLLPTVLSRCQRLHILRPSKMQALAWLAESSSAKSTPIELALALALSGDAPILAAQLLESGAAQSYQRLSAALDQGARNGHIDALAIGKQWLQRLPEFARLYEYYLVSQQRINANATEKTNSDARSAKIMHLSKQYHDLAKLREWGGTGVRIDLSIAALLDQHVAIV